MTLTQQIIERVNRLDADQQQKVLEFVRELERPRGEPGRLLIERTRHIQIAPEDLEEMARAIEEQCEQVDWNEWRDSA